MYINHHEFCKIGRRGTTKGSITRIRNRLKDLSEQVTEGSPSEVISYAKLLLNKLETLDTDFKKCHFALIELIEEPGVLDQEQKTLDEHDDEVAVLAVALQQLITAHSPSASSGLSKAASRQLARVNTSVSNISDSLAAASDDICLLQLNEDEIKGHRIELSEIRKELMNLDLEDDDELKVSVTTVEKALFDCSLELHRLLQPNKTSDSSSTISSESNVSKGVKLPMIEVPAFDGNILSWRTFWEQFSVAVHNHENISDSEKLVYLRHALKDSKALKAIEGLSRSGEHYVEAIELLQARFNRPRLIHQTHVSRILNAPSLKER